MRLSRRVIAAGVLVAVRQWGDVGDTAAAILLALSIVSVAAILVVAALDIARVKHRSGY